MKNLKNPSQIFPLFVTDKLAETRAFYLAAGFKIRLEKPEYLQVYYDGGLDLCFMRPHAANDGTEFPAFGGKGVMVSIPTRNADEKAVELKERRLPILSDVEDKPWGWRSFFVADPNGVILDFFHVYKEIDTPEHEQS